ncbi:hypothetical protein TrVE_jg470 [Triparma verrucosa]|uniref:Uncharacterized protein n=1 Tax=Triparma verrucosa TaxID=1606542 RepID=A0A9W7F243_9STRA|nr:hypothetical protein TrVE_jg470 [Triparma verrucosa]
MSTSPKITGRRASAGNAYAYGASDSSGFSGHPSTLDSAAYEEIGPQSYASTGTNGSSSSATEHFVERKDKDGNVMLGANGLPKKWRIKRRAGHRKRRKRPSSSVNSDSLDKNDTKEEDSDEDDHNIDSRIGDADDRVNDIDYLITTGMDIDYEDKSYVTQYVKVKKKKRRKFFSCFFKKKKVIGY